MPSIQSLKNNAAGRKKLQSLLEGKEQFSWLTGILRTMEPREGRAGWKSLFMIFEEDLKLLVQHRDPGIRYQAGSILVYSENSTSRAVLWELLKDNRPENRILMIRTLQSSDRQKLFNVLFSLYLEDPVFDVRKEALLRIRKDFSDLYTLVPDNLAVEAKIHCLELLEINSSHDHNLALHFMGDRDPGIILSAALYLEKSGTLDNLASGAKHKDMEDLKRRSRILSSAASHQVTSFLNKKENFKTRGSLYLALEIFNSGFTGNLFSWIINEIMDLNGGSPFIRELKDKAVKCLILRKDPDSIRLQASLLQSNRCSSTSMKLLLENLPREGSLVFYPVLKNFLLDSQFPLWESLVKSFVKIPAGLCLSDLYNLVRDSKTDTVIRKRAYILLSQYGEFSSTQFLLEHLPLLSREDMKILGRTVLKWNPDQFNKTVKKLLILHDSGIHQKLMQLLAQSGITDFVPFMEEKLSDSDPESRICALWSLRELKRENSFPKMSGLLYDPEMTVRSEAATVFVHWNREETFSELNSILQDEHESRSVQDAILRAMGSSDNIKIISMLVNLIESRPALREMIHQALLHKNSDAEIRELILHFSKVSDDSSKELIRLFREMGERVEESLMDLLGKTDDPSVKENISTVLDNTGYVENQVGILKSPFPSKRLAAAGNLSMIGTKKACRGLLWAARDINRDIRILAIRALVQIRESSDILDQLKEDPDKKVRRYAYWAEERVKAAKLP